MAGSSVSSVSSTTRKNGLRASTLCSKMLTSRPARPNARAPAATPTAISPSGQRRCVCARAGPGVGCTLIGCPSMFVPHVAVTSDARQFPGPARRRVDHLHDGLVTRSARLLGNAPVALADLDRLVEVPQREAQRVVETVQRF